MKIRFIITDDDGKDYEGTLELNPKKDGDKTGESISESIQENKYEGLRGGIRFLIDNEFLSQLRTAKNISEELRKEGYYYSIKSVDADLRKYFVSQIKVLSRIKENGKWNYIIRK